MVNDAGLGDKEFISRGEIKAWLRDFQEHFPREQGNWLPPAVLKDYLKVLREAGVATAEIPGALTVTFTQQRQQAQKQPQADQCGCGHHMALEHGPGGCLKGCALEKCVDLRAR